MMISLPKGEAVPGSRAAEHAPWMEVRFLLKMMIFLLKMMTFLFKNDDAPWTEGKFEDATMAKVGTNSSF